MRARLRARKRRSEHRAPIRLAISGLLVGLLVFGFIAFGVRSVNGVPGQHYGKLLAEIPDIGNLRPHDEIRIAGVRAGQVLSESLRDGSALLELQLAPGTQRLPVDTQVVVRARGLLGSRYLELIPGKSSQLLEDGDMIRAAPVISLTNGISDVLDTFDQQTRGRLGTMLGGLGEGVAGRGQQLNDLIRVGPGVTDQLTLVADSILARPGVASAFVPSVNAGMSALAGARDEIVGLLRAGAQGLTPFVQARSSMQATLVQAPPTLSALQSGLDTGRQLLAATNSLAQALNQALPRAPSALRDTAILLRESPVALARTSALLAAAQPAVPAVLQITGALSPNLMPLQRAFDDGLPIVASLGQHGCDVTNFASNWRSVLGYGAPSSRAVPGGDAGHFNQLRLNLIAGPQSFGSLAPPISRPFVHNRQVYEPACTHSPGPVYSQFGIGTPRSAG